MKHFDEHVLMRDGYNSANCTLVAANVDANSCKSDMQRSSKFRC
jgi:hypothetical protein